MTNVDPAEIAKFSELAHRWWDPGSEFKPLHDINPLRLDYIDGRAGLNGKTVLDVGCGGGILAESMAQRGADVTGIDLADKPLKVAQLHLLESGNQVDYRKISAEDLAQRIAAAFRRRHLHGIARTRAGSGEHGRRLRRARQTRRPRVLFHHQPQSEILFVRGHRRRIRAEAAAARHPRLREVHQTIGTRRQYAGRPASTSAG